MIGQGTFALGGEFGDAGEDDAMETVASVLEVGITLFDSASAYDSSRSERRPGDALSGFPPSSCVPSTMAGKENEGANRGHYNYSASDTRRSVRASLERVRVTHLDIVHLHDFERDRGGHL